MVDFFLLITGINLFAIIVIVKHMQGQLYKILEILESFEEERENGKR